MAEPLGISEVSRRTGISRTSLYRAIQDGRLSRYVVMVGGQRKLSPEALSAIAAGAIRQRIDSPWVQTLEQQRAELEAAAVEMEQPEPEPLPWSVLAPWCNACLAENWSPPPWPADRWATLSVVIEQAEGLARRYGPFSPEAWAQMETDLYGDDPEEEEDRP